MTTTNTFDNIQESKAQISSLPKAEFRTLHLGKVVEKEETSDFEDKLDDLEVGDHEVNSDPQSKGVAVVNREDGHVATVGTPEYDIIQHDEAVRPVLEALQDLSMDVEGTIQLRKNGDVVKFIGKTGEEFSVNGETYGIGFKLINTYNKSGSVRLKGFLFRQVCSNGMTVREDMGVPELRRQHRGDVEIVEQYKEWFEEKLIGNTDQVQQVLSQAMGDFFDVEDIVRVMENVNLPSTKIEDIAHLIEPNEDQPVDIPEGKISRKQMYDAVTNYISHELEGVAVATEERYQKKAMRILMQDKQQLLNPLEIEEKIERVERGEADEIEESADELREEFENKQRQVQEVAVK